MFMVQSSSSLRRSLVAKRSTVIRDVPNVSPQAGHLLDPDQLVDVDRLVGAYYDEQPDPSVEEQRVAFGTSGHRGSSLARTFNEAHVLAMS